MINNALERCIKASFFTSKFYQKLQEANYFKAKNYQQVCTNDSNCGQFIVNLEHIGFSRQTYINCRTHLNFQTHAQKISNTSKFLEISFFEVNTYLTIFFQRRFSRERNRTEYLFLDKIFFKKLSNTSKFLHQVCLSNTYF